MISARRLARRSLGGAWATVAALAFAASFASPAHAAEKEETPSARADRLFREGEALFDSRSYAEACTRFAESQRLDPRLGTLLNLAFCHESVGATARARAEFDEALVWAVHRGQKDREQFAREHLAALDRRLSFVTFEAPERVAEGTEVDIDGESIPRE